MLHRIAEYVDRKRIAYKPGYKRKSARYAIACDSAGTFAGLDRLSDTNREGRTFHAAPHFIFPEIKAGKGYKAQFLLDSAETVLLLAKSSDPKALGKHQYFWKMIAEAAASTATLAPIVHLGTEEMLAHIRKELSLLGAKSTDPVTFRVGSNFIVDQDSWHEWWELWRSAVVQTKSFPSRNARPKGRISAPMVSFLTCKTVVPTKTQPTIQGLPEGQSSGTSLVSFNASAFASYGLDQSLNAAMSEEEATKYVAGLDDLIHDSSHYLAGSQVVYWYNRALPTEDDLIGLVGWDDPQVEEKAALAEVRQLLDSIKTGERADLADASYYVLTLAGAGGRAMVRSWQEGPLTQLADNISRWFSDLEICTIRGSIAKSAPRINRLIECLLPPPKLKQDRKDWVRPVKGLCGPLWLAATERKPVPFGAVVRIVLEHRDFALGGGFDALFSASIRNRSSKDNQNVWLLWNRMSLLKAFHLRHHPILGGQNMQIHTHYNLDHPSPAYHCGGLMAVIAETQRAALKDVGASVIQRYYAAASATPGLVFGRLIRNTQYHLDKIEKERKYLAYWFSQRLADLSVRIGHEIPSTLTLEEQSLFALGFYQQIAERQRNNEQEKDSAQPEEAEA